MAERTKIGAGDDREQAVSRVEKLLAGDLAKPKAFSELTAAAKTELLRSAVVLLLRVAKRMLK